MEGTGLRSGWPHRPSKFFWVGALVFAEPGGRGQAMGLRLPRAGTPVRCFPASDHLLTRRALAEHALELVGALVAVVLLPSEYG